MTDDCVREYVQRLAEVLTKRAERLAVAESCTGGLIAARLTDRPGSSEWFECGLVTYSNASKQTLLGVSAETLAQDGAVSGPTVLAMTRGLVRCTAAQWAVAVSGVAGPGGGSATKPVGTVWIAWQGPQLAASASRFHFTGNRDQVHEQAVATALEQLLVLISP